MVLPEPERRELRRSARNAVPRFRVRRSTVAIAGLLSLIVFGVAIGLPYLSVPQHPTGMVIHWHPHLAVTINGQAVAVPAQIGIEPNLWKDHALDTYGMQAMPWMGMAGMAPLHTHDSTGKIHLESSEVRDYTISDFFRIWGETFDDQQVLGHTAPSGHRVWMVVDGTEAPPSTSLVLRDRMNIEIVCGLG